ncbi:glycosyltransferase family 39 protein [Butyrivibrio fibrisolvens]|uniref:glycosyltransferase family 39 protein n=1 Tax=Pseudobutyrivibrio ruminis TaxID=46206 RepID=UPI0004183112|nr:glycosyltransferase family 39 protein [Pseudobutyrivibrio ruminis]MDC7278820.1 glycosyltransferase family 39 protein [Butyrivibrio fibrisolvens]
MKLSIKSRQLFWIIVLLISVVSCIFLGDIVGESVYYFIDGLVITFLSVMLFFNIYSLKVSSNIKIVISIGVIFRVLLLLIASFNIGGIGAFFNSSDPMDFLRVGTEYYHGDYHDYITNYPHIIEILFNIFGPYQFVPRLVNILCWYAGVILIYYSAGKKLYGILEFYLIGFYCLLPMQLWVTVSIMRESIMELFLMIGVVYLYRWHKSGKLWYLVIAIIVTAPSVWLHAGCIAFWGTAFLSFIFWNERNLKWKLVSIKSGVLIILLLMSEVIYEKVLAKIFPEYCLTLSFSIKDFTDRPYVVGNSDYIVGSGVVSSLSEFVLSTVKRCFYFWVSPTPNFWNSLKDIVVFCIDSLPWVIVFYIMYKLIKHKQDSFVINGVILILMYALVYAWGTRNAFTAIRHRDMLSGPIVMMIMYSIPDISQKIHIKRNSVANEYR